MEPLPTRKRYYNPVLDPHCQNKMTPKMRDAVLAGTYDDGTTERGGPLNEPDLSHPANLVSSLCEDGLHRPALDIDIPCEHMPSFTEGHCHLYFPTIALEWDVYCDLLDHLAEVGILEGSYVDASKARGQTLLRPLGVIK